MSENETPTRRFPAGGISLEDRLENIEGMCKEILEKADTTASRVAELDKTVALINAKLALHDMILMGVCGSIGVAVIVAVLAKVIH